MNMQTALLLLFGFGIPLLGATIGGIIGFKKSRRKVLWTIVGAGIGIVVGIIAILIIGLIGGGFEGFNYVIS